MYPFWLKPFWLKYAISVGPVIPADPASQMSFCYGVSMLHSV